MSWRRAVLIAYSLWAVYKGGSLLLTALPTRVVPAFNEFNGDCLVDLIAANAFYEGWDPWSPEGLKRAAIPNLGHPPTTPFWFLPFHGMHPVMLHGVVGSIVCFLLIFELVILCSELAIPAALPTALVVLGFVLSQSWMQYHLNMVQIGQPTAFLLVVSWYFLRREQQVGAGVSMGLACTLKLFPGLLMIFFALSRRWRAFAAGAVTWLAIAAYMTAHYGLASWREFFAKQPEINDFWAANIKNGALSGVVLRLFWPACGPRGPNLPKAQIITVVVSVLLVVLAWRASRRMARRPGGVDGPFALFLTLSVFLNPVVWEHYYVLLIPPLFIAGALLRDAWRAGLGWLPAAAGAATLAATVWLLDLDMGLKTTTNGHVPALHLRMHLYEVANWLPWVSTAALLAALVVWFDRRPGRISTILSTQP